MAKRKVISNSNLPAKFPLTLFIVGILALDRMNAPQWLWGVFGTLMVVLFIAVAWVKWSEEDETDIFEKKEKMEFPPLEKYNE